MFSHDFEFVCLRFLYGSFERSAGFLIVFVLLFDCHKGISKQPSNVEAEEEKHDIEEG